MGIFIWPTADVGGLADSLRLVVSGTVAGDSVNGFLTEPDRPDSSYAVNFSFNTAEQSHLGETLHFIPVSRAGHAKIQGSHKQQFFELNVDYRLQQVSNLSDTTLFSNDGNFKLYLEAGSLAVNQGPFLIASPWGLPGPLPPGLDIVGEAYEVTAAANITTLQKPTLLRFHYDPLAGEPLQNPAIYRWHTPSASWQAMGGQIDLEKREVTTTTTELGIYTLLGTPSTKSAYVKQDNPCLSVPQETVYLPLLVK